MNVPWRMQIDFGSELVVHPGFNKFSAFVLGLFVVVENVVRTVDVKQVCHQSGIRHERFWSQSRFVIVFFRPARYHINQIHGFNRREIGVQCFPGDIEISGQSGLHHLSTGEDSGGFQYFRNGVLFSDAPLVSHI